MEVRLYAEDVTRDFLPCTGSISRWVPASGEGIRFDSGILPGQEISPFYDPMIAKVIAYGDDRETARHRLIEALKNTVLFGLTTNRGFLIDILSRDSFARGAATTAFIADEFTEADLAAKTPSEVQTAIAAVLQYRIARDQILAQTVFVSDKLVDWSSGGALLTRYIYEFGDEAKRDVTISPKQNGGYDVNVGGAAHSVAILEMLDNKAQVTVDGFRYRVHFAVPAEGILDLAESGQTLRFVNMIDFAVTAEVAAGVGRITAPMHGTILDVFVKTGETVEAGARLAVLEAMKMQHDIIAQIDGIVQDVLTATAAQVAVGDVLFEIEAAE